MLGTPIAPPFPEGLEQAVFGMGCFWGAERVFWQAPGVYTTAVGYAGGYTPNPTYEEVCSGADRPHRGRARRLRPEADELRGAAQAVLGEPRPDAGHAPGQRRRHPVPLGDLHHERRAARGGRGVAARVPARAERRRLRRDHHRDRAARARSTTPRTTTSSTSRRTRTATAASAAPASPARWASAPPLRRRRRPGARSRPPAAAGSATPRRRRRARGRRSRCRRSRTSPRARAASRRARR